MSKGPAENQKKGHHEPAAEASAPKGKAGAPVVGGCNAVGCRKESAQFGFCAEHYDHFKFGLIKKNGQPVPDYEKKFGHYVAHKARRGAHKVA